MEPSQVCNPSPIQHLVKLFLTVAMKLFQQIQAEKLVKFIIMFKMSNQYDNWYLPIYWYRPIYRHCRYEKYLSVSTDKKSYIFSLTDIL